ncbi:oligosaccharide flippase family protein [Planobacterium oryzisoli]|uniref:Oligosaccharide flippase family protein n=1 Tax=Planobacterium oryzisoli TaxID=2771435 RepID=A0A930YVL4_9FLAO|nr:oligosaccharide flippase family protein [Planobacterium oryzisoli]MBF5027131.1 oligosaccharide flippase family protein [Planobacterium oryzisoli]
MSSYKIILKTTGLFASLRVLSILINIATSKLIAVLVGASGIGLYGIYTNALSLITTISDLGVSKSSIRNIAKAEGTGNKSEVEKTISLVSQIIYITGAIGSIITILLSYQISKWSFGDSSYWLSFVLLGICVFFTILKNGQSAILQGLRKYKLITNSTILSSLISFIISIPLIYFFKEKSIVYIILSGAFIAFIVTNIYLKKIDYQHATQKVKLTKENSSELIRLGLAMMLVSFLVALSGYIIRAFISNYGSVDDLGFFQAGFQIISGYFGIIFTSMTTDYFPRISAIQDDNEKLTQEVNQQAIITLLLICPLVVILPFLMPLVIEILYAKGFEATVDYVNIALFGIIFQAGSQTMGMILLAKNNAKVFTVSVFLFQTIFLILNILGYKYYGILGLGITFSINMLIHIIGVQVLNYVLYKISFNKHFFITFALVLLFALAANFTIRLNEVYQYVFGAVIILGSFAFVMMRLKKLLKINSFVGFIKNKLRGSNKKNV